MSNIREGLDQAIGQKIQNIIQLGEDANRLAQLQSAYNQAVKITKGIKYDDTVVGIISEIQTLANQYKIDARSVKYAIDDVLEAKNNLESKVYGLDEVFKDAFQEEKWKTDDEEIDEGQIYSTGGGAGQSYRKFRPKAAGAKESAIMKGLQAEDNINEYDIDSSRKIVFSKENPPNIDQLYQQFIHVMLSSENKIQPKDWINSVNKKYGTNYTWKDYQIKGHKDYVNNWDKIVKKYILNKGYDTSTRK